LGITGKQGALNGELKEKLRTEIQRFKLFYFKWPEVRLPQVRTRCRKDIWLTQRRTGRQDDVPLRQSQGDNIASPAYWP
jgi:hypothetical protein